ncbi:hypothetical protein SAMN02910447_01979 [Ruminococcus sp. YE71]|nr:hypothetical protein SAMN02910446_02917 [Ruminococcus sp. YE78]SFW35403.1 hypothetical protein SAMN02910447_01979 [Ruminococcus sp. YE71]
MRRPSFCFILLYCRVRLCRLFLFGHCPEENIFFAPILLDITDFLWYNYSFCVVQ